MAAKKTAGKPYTGFDGNATGKRPGTQTFVALCIRRWGGSNLGTWVIRDMRDKPGQPSIHGTGRALDWSFGDGPKGRAAAKEALEWFATNWDALGIEEIHDYLGILTGKPQGWRCDRAAWKAWTPTDNGGTGGAWIHVELRPEAADDADYEARWRKVAKPA